MYDSAFTGKEMAFNNWNCILSTFLTSFNICFCLVMHVLCIAYLHVLGLLSGLFWLFLRQGLFFLVNLIACC